MDKELENTLLNLKYVSENDHCIFTSDKEASKLLYDYIINLQQENEKLKEDITTMNDYIGKIQKENNILKENAEHNDKVVDKAKWNGMIYKSRNEKAYKIIDEALTEQMITGNATVNLIELCAVLKGSDR